MENQDQEDITDEDIKTKYHEIIIKIIDRLHPTQRQYRKIGLRRYNR